MTHNDDSYLTRLKRHPGLPAALFMTAAFTVAGWERAWWCGPVFSLMFWISVLITARKV